MKLKRFELIAGGQFTGANGPIVIDFSESPLIGAKVDEEGGKTTLVEIMKLNAAMIGGDKVIADLKNRETGGLKSKLVFQEGKADWEVLQEDGKLTVRREGEKQPGGPQTLLRSLLGVVGLSPMGIKDADIDEIVKWLANYSTRGAEEFVKEMKKCKDGQKKAKNDRAAANRSAKGAKEYLIGEGYADAKGNLIESVWVKSEKDYETEPDIKELSKKLTAAGSKSDKYVENETKVAGQKTRKEQIVKQIKELKKELTQVDENISLGEKWLTANKTAKADYDKIKKQYDNAAQDVANYNKWQEVKKKKAEMDSFEDVAQKADASEKAFIKKQQELQWEVIPDIKGVEIILEDTHEDEGVQKKAGYYFNGLNSRQLSASQWFGQVIQILKKNKIKFLIVDDISQFGSKFMELLESLTKSGCYVFYTEMMRGQDEIILDYNLKKAV